MDETKTEPRLPWMLARLADCADPDSVSSPGALFLFGVEDHAREVWEDRDDSTDMDDRRHEVADAVVPIYTHDLWRVFVDLAAYNEDPTEFGVDASDMEKAAGVCLYMVADRLCHALWEEWEDEDEG